MRDQRGFTLVELLITIAIMGIVGSLVGGSLVEILDMTDYGNRDLTASNDLQKAAYWLNLDAQTAVAASSGGTSLLLTLPDTTTVSYALVSTDLQRTAGAATSTLAHNVSALIFSVNGHTVSMDITIYLAGRDAVVAQQTYQISMRPQVYIPPPEYRMKLTFDNSGSASTLASFPVLIRLTNIHSDFWARVSSAITTADTKDVHFRDSDAVTELYFEAELIDYANKLAYFWVKVPQVDAASSTDFIYVYYGLSGAIQSSYNSPNNVYDTSFRMVQHLEENTADINGIRDSTANNNHGTPYSNVTPTNLYRSSNQVDGGVYTRGGGSNRNYIRVANASSLNFTSAITWEAWASTLANNVSDTVLSKGNQGILKNNNNGWRGSAVIAGTTRTLDWGSGRPTQNTWYHVAFTYDGANMRIFVNGTQTNSSARTGALTSNTSILAVGSTLGTGSYFNGYLDEVTLSSTARSAGWIRARYLSQNYSFVTFGTSEPVA